MNDAKQNCKNNSFALALKIIVRNKINQGDERLIHRTLKHTAERNLKRPKTPQVYGLQD